MNNPAVPRFRAFGHWQPLVLTACVLTAIMVGLNAARVATGPAGNRSLVFGAELIGLFCLAVLPISFRVRHAGAAALVDPVSVIGAGFLLFYVLRGTLLLKADSLGLTLFWASVSGRAQQFLTSAAGYALAGFAAFHIGYRSWRLEPSTGCISYTRCKEKALRNVIAVALAGGLFSLLVAILASGGISQALAAVGRARNTTEGFGYLLLGLTYLPLGALLLMADQILGRKHWVGITVLGALSMISGALMGNRTGVFALWTSMAALYVVTAQRKKAMRIVVVGAVVVATTVAFAGPMALIRERATGISDIPQLYVSFWASDQAEPSAGIRILDEFVCLDTFAALLSAPKTFPLQYGKTYLDSALFLIPRAIYPHKPESFSFALGEYLSGEHNDIPPGLIGELYHNFHVAGVIVGMLIFGIVCRYFYSFCTRPGGNPTWACVYVMSLPYLLVFLSRSFLGGGVLMLASIGPALPLAWYLSHPRPDPTRGAVR